MPSDTADDNLLAPGDLVRSDSSGDENPPTAKVSWIYTLKKEELISELKKFNLSRMGTMPILRRRLVTFFREGPPKGEPVNQPAISSPSVVEAEAAPFEPAMSTPRGISSPRSVSQRSRGDICETVRKWRLQFDGGTDAVEFLEKLYDLQEHCDISTSELLPVLFEVFQGKALAWYRNNRSLWTSWNDFLSDFKQFYLPSDYQDYLEEQIYNRRQRPGESGRDYVVALQTLIRRHGEFTQAKVLHRTYGNLLPEYRQYIRRSDLQNVRDLVARIDEFEKLQVEMQYQVDIAPDMPHVARRSSPPLVARPETPVRKEREAPPDTAGAPSPPPRHTIPNRTYEAVDRQQGALQGPAMTPSPQRTRDTARIRTYGEVVSQQPPGRSEMNQGRIATPSPRPSICFRCGKAGHFRAECRAPPRQFCSRCGRNGVMTRDCRCHNPEN